MLAPYFRSFGFWIGSTLCLAGATSEESVQSLAARIGEHLEAPRFARSMWGVKVVSLETGRVWFDQNGGKLMKPASNAKLFTGALALSRFGPTHRFGTTLFRDGQLAPSGALRGDLVVYGRGDPSFAARFNDGDSAHALAPFVEAIKAAGVRRVEGDLVGDESYFRGPPWGHGWTWDDLQYYYGAEVSSLTVEDNVVELLVHPGPRVGALCRVETKPPASTLQFSNRTVTVDADGDSRVQVSRLAGESIVYVTGQLPLGGSPRPAAVTVSGPANWFLGLLREALVEAGIPVAGQARTITWLDRELRPIEVESWVELAKVQGQPVDQIVGKMMKPSQNLYAQLLLLAVGAVRQTQDPILALRPTEQAGLAELRAFLREAGIDENEVLLEEGSGLSRGGLVTPNAVVSLLRYMDEHRWSQPFLDSLPVAGQDGALRPRFQGTPAAGNVRAKTGTLRFVHALSGYATAGSGERLVFSIMLNNHQSSAGAPPARAELDEIVLMLVGAGNEDRPARGE